MVTEEAIKILKQVQQWTDYPKEAFTMAIKALEQSLLPSNLDEAAEKFSKRQGTELAPFAKKFFIAGVKWLTTQGETQEFEVSKDEDEDGDENVEQLSFYLNWLGQDGLVVVNPNKYKDGDIVELQLRKKL